MIFPFYSLIAIVSALLFAFYFVNSLNLTTQKPSLDRIHRFLLLLTTLFFCVDAIWGFYDSGIFTSIKGFFITTTCLFTVMSFVTFSWILYAIVYLENVKILHHKRLLVQNWKNEHSFVFFWIYSFFIDFLFVPLSFCQRNSPSSMEIYNRIVFCAYSIFLRNTAGDFSKRTVFINWLFNGN